MIDNQSIYLSNFSSFLQFEAETISIVVIAFVDIARIVLWFFATSQDIQKIVLQELSF